MNTYKVNIRRNGDFYVDEQFDIPELNTFVTVGIRDDYSRDAFVVYVDLNFNTPYLQIYEDFYTTDHHTLLIDEENQICFDISF